MEIRSVFLKLTKAARTAHYLDDAMQTAGYPSSPYADIFGHIADAIYTLLDEHTDTFDESITYASVLSFVNSDEQCAEFLYRAYKKDMD